MNRIKVLTIIFDNKLSNWELPYFRGAIINLTQNAENELFHNHINDKFRYSYPLIQYKTINGRAAIVCIQQGVEAIGDFFVNYQDSIRIGERCVKLKVDKVLPLLFQIQTWEAKFMYRIRNWLPLNSSNYQKIQEVSTDEEKLLFLEKILIGNILSMSKGIGIHIEKQIDCKILKIGEPRIVSNNHTKLISFNIEFITNISLPNHLGLGKNVSIGYGVIKQIKNKD